MVSKGHTIPQNWSISGLIGLSISVFSNYILHSVKFTSTVIGIEDYLLPSNFGLLFSIHYMVCVNTVLVPLICNYGFLLLLIWHYLLLTSWYHSLHAWVSVASCHARRLLAHLTCDIILILNPIYYWTLSRSWYFKTLWMILLLHLVLTYLTLIFRSLSWALFLIGPPYCIIWLYLVHIRTHFVLWVLLYNLLILLLLLLLL